MTDVSPSGAAESKPPFPKEPRTPRSILNIGLLAFMIVSFGYGLPLLLWPDVLWGTVGGAEGDFERALGTTRWAGAFLTAWAVGAFFVFTRPKGQRTFVTTITLQASLASAALFVSAVSGEFDDVVDTWFPWLSAVIVGLLALYLWYARVKARDILHV